MRYLLAILLLAISVTAQTPCDHQSNKKSRFDATAVSPPVKISFWDGKRLEVRFEDSESVNVLILEADKQSVIDVPKDWKEKFFWLLYCEKNHTKDEGMTIHYLYVITPVLPHQIKKQ